MLLLSEVLYKWKWKKFYIMKHLHQKKGSPNDFRPNDQYLKLAFGVTVCFQTVVTFLSRRNQEIIRHSFLYLTPFAESLRSGSFVSRTNLKSISFSHLLCPCTSLEPQYFWSVTSQLSPLHPFWLRPLCLRSALVLILKHSSHFVCLLLMILQFCFTLYGMKFIFLMIPDRSL